MRDYSGAGNADMCDQDVKHTHDFDVNADAPAVMLNVPSREETLGDIVIALLRSGQVITRRTLCLKVVARMDVEDNPVMQAHLGEVMRLILRNNPF